MIMTRDIDFGLFYDAFLRATGLIPEIYYNLPIAGGSPKYRERVYCYELYHILRDILPNDFPYVLSGEVDKSGHPVIANACGEIIPDFLVHKPGQMESDSNLAIVEVKSISGARTDRENRGILEDFNKIKCMLNLENGYYKAIILVFGNGDDVRYENIRLEFNGRCRDYIDRIELLFHKQAGQRAIRIHQITII